MVTASGRPWALVSRLLNGETWAGARAAGHAERSRAQRGHTGPRSPSPGPSKHLACACACACLCFCAAHDLQSASDWRLLNPNVVPKLRQYVQQGYRIAIFV